VLNKFVDVTYPRPERFAIVLMDEALIEAIIDEIVELFAY
jgi:hypothetical protein